MCYNIVGTDLLGVGWTDEGLPRLLIGLKATIQRRSMTMQVHSSRLVVSIFNAEIGNPINKLVLMALCHHYPNIFPGQERLARMTSITSRAVRNSLTWLCKHDWVSKRRTNRSNVYALNVERILRVAQGRLSRPERCSYPDGNVVLLTYKRTASKMTLRVISHSIIRPRRSLIEKCVNTLIHYLT